MCFIFLFLIKSYFLVKIYCLPRSLSAQKFICFFFFVWVATVSARAGPRTQIAIPAQGMIEFRDALTDLLEEYGTDDGGFKGDLPEGRHLRVEDKTFYFDIGQNSRGIYMRVSEVRINCLVHLFEVLW